VSRGGGRGAPSLWRSRLQDGGATLGASRGGAELRSACNRIRPALPRRRCVLEGGDGACRACLVAKALAKASRFSWAEPARASCPISRTTRPNPRQPRKRFDSDAQNGLAESVRAQ